MQSKEIRRKARQFLSVNTYQPIIVFAMIVTVFLAFFMFTIFLAVIKLWLIIFGILLLAVLYVFSAPLKISLTDYYLRSYNQKTAERFIIFEGYKREYIWRSVLLRLINTGIMLGLSLLLIVPGIVYFSRSAYSFYLLKVNPDLSPWQAVKQSNRLMRRSGKKYLSFSFGYFGWFLLTVVTLGIASFYVTPYFHTAKSIFFRNVLLQKDDDDPNYLNDINDQIGAILNSEIANIEKEIQMLQKQTIKPPGQGGSAQPQNRKLFDNVAPPSSPKAQSNSGERLYMDDIGDIRGIISGLDDVEEMVLPEIKTNSARNMPNADFNTRDVEIMENESFEEFKARLNNLRSQRDKARSEAAHVPEKKPEPQFKVNLETEKTAKDFRTIPMQKEKNLFEKEKLDLEIIDEAEDVSAPNNVQEPASEVKTAPPVQAAAGRQSMPSTGDGKLSQPTPSAPRPAQASQPSASARGTATSSQSQSLSSRPSQTGATTTTTDGQRLSRAEILEKLKAERAMRTQAAEQKLKDKQE